MWNFVIINLREIRIRLKNQKLFISYQKHSFITLWISFWFFIPTIKDFVSISTDRLRSRRRRALFQIAILSLGTDDNNGKLQRIQYEKHILAIISHLTINEHFLLPDKNPVSCMGGRIKMALEQVLHGLGFSTVANEYVLRFPICGDCFWVFQHRCVLPFLLISWRKSFGWLRPVWVCCSWFSDVLVCHDLPARLYLSWWIISSTLVCAGLYGGNWSDLSRWWPDCSFHVSIHLVTSVEWSNCCELVDVSKRARPQTSLCTSCVRVNSISNAHFYDPFFNIGFPPDIPSLIQCSLALVSCRLSNVLMGVLFFFCQDMISSAG